MFGLSGDNAWIILLVALWTIPWKGFALWRAAHRNDKWWFVVFLVVNALAIPEILYLVFTRKKKHAHADINTTPHDSPPTAI